ncbi:MAG TPA: NADH-quinone oxidoreductase subunit NuoF, partial [Bdellovibrionota bacterium]|nr:NADH-quinone oxidoreductase subunit NuoF [Bdellovibrionota bacterium]
FFPTGRKASFIPTPDKVAKPIYLTVNADESEPGTFKDRDIMRYTPHLLIEGMVIGGYTIGAHIGYIYIRGEYTREAKLLQAAIDEAYAKGYLGKNIQGSGFSFDLTVHRGAGAYICGEETGLLNSLEGKRGEPRVKPPFPAQAGAFGGPTIVNNVETLAAVPHIINRGGKWFSSLGAVEKSGGTRLFCVSGHVKKPGLYELPSGGVTLRQLIYDYCGGILGDKKLKAVIPGGSSAPVLTPDEIDVVLDIEPLMKIGSMLGSAGIMVVSEDYCLVRLIWRITKFYDHESCGQCTPCREGCRWMKDILWRIENGNGRETDLPLLLDIANNINGKTLCALGDAAAGPVSSFVRKFKADFEAHIRGKRCPHAP